MPVVLSVGTHLYTNGSHSLCSIGHRGRRWPCGATVGVGTGHWRGSSLQGEGTKTMTFNTCMYIIGCVSYYPVFLRAEVRHVNVIHVNLLHTLYNYGEHVHTLKNRALKC